MKIVLATGIYPPAIGGPATYAHALAKELARRGETVVVVTYGDADDAISVPRSGGPLFRWLRYAKALKKYASDADIVIAFSSVSCGVPLKMARLKKPKKILRLGGDFFWERYTDRGGLKSLREWYIKKPWSMFFMKSILRTFDHIVFSTALQQGIYEMHYKDLPTYSVLENAVPTGSVHLHEKHNPLRLLFMGRFVGFKNLPSLVQAVSQMQDVHLTFIGDGPMRKVLQHLAKQCGVQQRCIFLPPVHGEEKQKVFAEYDLLVIPSVTEISPNSALEARAAGLPILLSAETGFAGSALEDGMVLRTLGTPNDIADAVQEVGQRYAEIARDAAQEPVERNWEHVAREWMQLFSM